MSASAHASSGFPRLLGLHHVTATSDGAQADLDFYAGLLGLRLVKKTVNFGDHGVYHFYYGNGEGSPSTLWTTFPYRGKGMRVGRKGAGQITETSFSVPRGAIDFWAGRFATRGAEVRGAGSRFGEETLRVEDPSGLRIELVERPDDTRTPWVVEGVPAEAAVRGLHSVTLLVRAADPSVAFLTAVLGAQIDVTEGARTRLWLGKERPGGYLEVVEDAGAPRAENGLGTIHHVAFEVSDREAQLEARERLQELGVHVTPVRDRQYFTSIYFREPGGILYEIATSGPGFLIDEEPEELGGELRVPAWEEGNRSVIEAALPPVTPPTH